MDFGIGFLSNKVMLPILDFSTGSCQLWTCDHALTLVVRFALYPLSAGSIRNMRRASYSTVDAKAGQRNSRAQQRQPCQAAGRNEFCLQRQSAGWVFSSAGANAGTFALFATLRGSPFSDVNYTVNLQIFPLQIEQIQPQASATSPKTSISAMGFMFPTAIVPGGNRLTVGEKKTKSNFKP